MLIYIRIYTVTDIGLKVVILKVLLHPCVTWKKDNLVTLGVDDL